MIYEQSMQVIFKTKIYREKKNISSIPECKAPQFWAWWVGILINEHKKNGGI
jgi:hypothetical protein